MKKLKFIDFINFAPNVKNLHNLSLWEGREHGLYIASIEENGIRNKFIVAFGIDANLPNSGVFVFSMPLIQGLAPEDHSPEITREPMQLVQFDGTAITGDVLLKAIAIVQNPNLAKDLL